MYCSNVFQQLLQCNDDINFIMKEPVMYKKKDAIRKLELCDHLIR